MPRIDTLHVAALPYPTSQGTQAAIGCMVAALAGLGRSTALLTYASGSGHETRFEHRVAAGRMKPRSLRSGPSFEKIAADVELALALREQAKDARVIVAHHVEAAAIAHALRLPRWIFVAHTTLGPELPTYLPRVMGPFASRAGRRLDRWLASVAPGVAAISTHVAKEIARSSGREALVLPTPMTRSTDRPRRENARRALGIDGRVVLYAGNLDAYQGLPVLVDAIAELRATMPDAQMLVATESSPSELARAFARRGVRAHFVPLATETDRANAHAAADVAVVTRGTPGGFPIKLLDAIAREVPIVAMRRALSGDDVPGVRVTHDDSASLARGLRASLTASASELDSQVALASRHLATRHDASSFAAALDAVTIRLQGERAP